MKYEEKKERITKLDETNLRRRVILPLLKALGFIEVHEFHGGIEKGKDIIFREASKIGEPFIHAVVVTTDDITGKVGDSKSASRILDQTEMVLNESYTDKYTGKVMRVDRCWVITSGTIKPTAIESIAGKLEKYNLNRLVRFVDIDRLIELTDNFYPQFWERKEEPAFYSRYEHIDISTNKLDPPYDKEVHDLSVAGSLKDTVYSIKQLAYSLLLECDQDFRDKLADLLRTRHPWKVAEIWEVLDLDRINKDGHVYLGRKIDEIRQQWQYLVDDLSEYERRFGIKPEHRYPK